MSLPELPKITNGERDIANKDNKNSEDGYVLPKLSDSNSSSPPEEVYYNNEETNYDEYVWIDERNLDKDPYASIINQGLLDSYDDLKESYGNIISIIEGASYEVYVPEEESSLNSNNFETIKELEDAINEGTVDLTEYDMEEIDLLLKELESLEEDYYYRDINDYGLETVDDFYLAVESGELDLSKYEMKEIDTLIKSLEDDKTMMLSEFDMSIYGDDDNEKEIKAEQADVDIWEDYWDEVEEDKEGFFSRVFRKILNLFS